MLPSNDPGRTPTYDLEEVQRRVGQGAISCRVTRAALLGGRALGIAYDRIIEAVLSLRTSDFYKSMPSAAVPGSWQDVYHLSFDGARIYVKIQINAGGEAVVIQFKEL